MRICKMFKKYEETSKAVKALEIPIKKKLLYLGFSFLVSVIVFSGPLCILINLMIFKDLQKLLAFGIATILVLFIALINYIYLKCVTDGRVKNIRVILLTDTFILAIVVYILLILIYFMGVL